jgi:membrane-associated phospholipid phosphatase
MGVSAASASERTGRAPRWLLLLLFLSVANTVAGLVGLDSALAQSITRSRSLDPIVDFLEVITLKSVSEFILPLVLLLSGGGFWAFGRTEQGRAMCYTGLVPLIAYLVSDLSKPQFGRLRPFEVMESGFADQWFAAGNSFPSGHTAFFAGLVVPIVVLYRHTWPLLAIPIVVATQRVLATDHYISDVSVSFGLALGAAALLLPVIRVGSSASTAHG